MRTIRWIFFVAGIFLMMPVGILSADQRPENGTVKEYDGRGRLKAILKYRDGAVIRKRIYDESGQIVIDKAYRDEKLVMIKTYYLNGVLKSFWSKKRGEAQYYYPNGKHKITVPIQDSSKLEHSD